MDTLSRTATSPRTDATAWVRAMFRTIDAKDTSAFLGFLTPDARSPGRGCAP